MESNGEDYTVDFTVDIGHFGNRDLHGSDFFEVSFDVTDCDIIEIIEYFDHMVE